MLNLVFFDYPLFISTDFVLPCPAFLLCYSFFSQMEPIGTSGKKVSQKGLIYTLERSKNYMEAKAIFVAWRVHVLLFLILASNIYRQPQKYSQYNYFG